jgi:hypothetical protein
MFNAVIFLAIFLAVALSIRYLVVRDLKKIG